MTDTPRTSPEAVERLAQMLETDASDQNFMPDELTGLLPDNEYEIAATLRALSADRDEALNQLDSARHSVDVLESRVAKLKAERDAANSAGWVLLREIYSRDAYMSPALKAIHNRLVRHQKETDT